MTELTTASAPASAAPAASTASAAPTAPGSAPAGVTHPKTKDAAKCYAFMEKCMTTPLWWCPEIPLAAEGGYAPNYSK